VIDSTKQGACTTEEDFIVAVLKQVRAAWPYHQHHIRKNGGHVRISFSPGLGQANITWSDETVKPNKPK
jgi:hypothetical protein